MAAIDVDGLRKTYGSTVAVDDLSFSVTRREVFGVIGPNGAGKTTAVECMAGLREPDAGRIRVLGLDPHADEREVRRKMGLQLQESALPDRITVAEAIELFRSFYRSPVAADALMDRWGLYDCRDTAYTALSGGQKQRLSLALALVHDPELVVLDELSAGLDPQARMEAQAHVRTIRDRGATVVLVTHFMEEAEALCDRVALIDDGRLVALDTPHALAAGLDADVRVRFTAPQDLDVEAVRALSGAQSVVARGRRVTVYGRDGLLSAVAGLLKEAGPVPPDLRAEPTTLDDAFLALTGEIDV
jgi:ABC-2 type transport system ATP-binding protein